MIVKPLSDWLQASGRSLDQLARELDRSPHTVEKYLYGARSPSLRVLAKLEELSQGEIRASSFLPPALGTNPSRGVS